MLTKNHPQLTAEVAKHVAADQVEQGCYWIKNAQRGCFRGCFIGCLAHGDYPRKIEGLYGVPEALLRICERIFENLKPDEATAFFAAFPAAVGRDGKDLRPVVWQFFAAELAQTPVHEPEAQGIVPQVLAGLGLLAAGAQWPEAEAVRTAVAAYVNSHYDTAAELAYAITRLLLGGCAWATCCELNHIRARQQRDNILQLIAAAE